jgi:hypothetical protein
MTRRDFTFDEMRRALVVVSWGKFIGKKRRKVGGNAFCGETCRIADYRRRKHELVGYTPPEQPKKKGK